MRGMSAAPTDQHMLNRPTKSKLIRITTVPVSLKVLLRRQLKFMADHFEVIAVSSPGTELDDVQHAEGVRTVAVPMTRAITPWQDIKALWRLYRLFRKERPAIVHTHTPKAGLLGMIAAKMAGVPVRLHTVAGLPSWRRKDLRAGCWSLLKKLLTTALRKYIPIPNGSLSFWSIIVFVKTSKLQVLGNGSSNGIDTTHFKVTAALEVEARQLRREKGMRLGILFLYLSGVW